MKLEQQVCSLELAKRLKELGVKQESYFVWANYIGQPPNFESSWTLYPSDSEDWENQEAREHIAAFTVAELGEMLPMKVGDVYHEIETTYEGTGDWTCRIVNIVSGKSTERRHADSEADARAKMLIYLLENKLITLP